MANVKKRSRTIVSSTLGFAAGAVLMFAGISYCNRIVEDTVSVVQTPVEHTSTGLEDSESAKPVYGVNNRNESENGTFVTVSDIENQIDSQTEGKSVGPDGKTPSVVVRLACRVKGAEEELSEMMRPTDFTSEGRQAATHGEVKSSGNSEEEDLPIVVGSSPRRQDMEEK